MKRFFAGLFVLILTLSFAIVPTHAEGTAADAPTTVGAIRWDAWYGHDGRKGSVISQVEKSLSPAKYHFRAPFFARVTDEGTIEIPEYTQEIFDREMEYAIEAGIDYFAYVWYGTDMKKARQFHVQSRYRNEVKMCACFDGNALCQSYARKEMETLWQDECYMKIDGRPLMYYFGSTDNLDRVKEDIEYYKKLAEKLGMPEPYAVLMNSAAGSVKTVGANAISKYAYGLTGGVPFATLAEKTEEIWETWRLTATQIVPIVTTGWHTGTRYENPVSWTTVSEDSWVEYAKPEEITAHLTNALNYMQRREVRVFAKANTVIMYAWNEHDEGGWICPTIAVDEDGNQLFNEDGTAKVNDERVKAVRAAIDAVRGGAAETPVPTQAGETPTEPGVAEPVDYTTENIIWISAGVVIVGASVAACVLIVKKRKKEE